MHLLMITGKEKARQSLGLWTIIWLYLPPSRAGCWWGQEARCGGRQEAEAVKTLQLSKAPDPGRPWLHQAGFSETAWWLIDARLLRKSSSVELWPTSTQQHFTDFYPLHSRPKNPHPLLPLTTAFCLKSF